MIHIMLIKWSLLYEWWISERLPNCVNRRGHSIEMLTHDDHATVRPWPSTWPPK